MEKYSTYFKSILNTILLLGVVFTMNAQLQNANWYFGNQAGLNFNDGTTPPTELTNSAMSTTGGCVTVSDDTGNLLFYTNGVTILDRDHGIMTNGSGLFGSPTVSQSVVVVPKPDDAAKYYVFTNQGKEVGSNGLSYSVVDVVNISDIHVETSQKNIALLAFSSEKLTTVFNPTDSSYWLISFAPGTDPSHSDTFYSFKVNSLGITLINQSTFSFLPDEDAHTGGQLKISPDGTALAMVHNTRGEANENVYSFDFDITTGIVSSQVTYPIDNVLYCYGLEFSPDSDKFYVTSTHQKSDGAPVNDVYQIWYRNAETNYYPVQYIGSGNTTSYSLQLALDGFIYGANNTDELNVIYNPNGICQNASFESNAIQLNGKIAIKGLPQLVPYNSLGAKPSNTKNTVIRGNPFKDELNLHLNKIQTVEFYNTRGDKVKTVVYNNSIEREDYNIDTSNLPQDMYFLVIKDMDSKVWNETVLKI